MPDKGDIAGVRVIRDAEPLALATLPTNEGEEWRYWPEDDTWAISSHGRIARTLAGGNRRAGDLVAIQQRPAGAEAFVGGRYRQVARLVLETFIGPPSDPAMRAHRADLNPANNRLDNLSWAYRSTILTHDYGAGRARHPKGAFVGTIWTGRHTTPEEQAAFTARVQAVASATSIHAIAAAVGCHYEVARRWVRGTKVPNPPRYGEIMAILNDILITRGGP